MSDDQERPVVHGYENDGSSWVATGGERTNAPSLPDFLLARCAEDEEVARAVTSSGPWVAVPASDPYRPDAADVARVEGGDEYSPDYVALDGDGLGSTTTANAEHIARWDPVRVLAECEAKRRIVEFYAGPRSGHYVLNFLALAYADHPDYREEWRR